MSKKFWGGLIIVVVAVAFSLIHLNLPPFEAANATGASATNLWLLCEGPSSTPAKLNVEFVPRKAAYLAPSTDSQLTIRNADALAACRSLKIEGPSQTHVTITNKEGTGVSILGDPGGPSKDLRVTLQNDPAGRYYDPDFRFDNLASILIEVRRTGSRISDSLYKHTLCIDANGLDLAILAKDGAGAKVENKFVSKDAAQELCGLSFDVRPKYGMEVSVRDLSVEKISTFLTIFLSTLMGVGFALLFESGSSKTSLARMDRIEQMLREIRTAQDALNHPAGDQPFDDTVSDRKT